MPPDLLLLLFFVKPNPKVKTRKRRHFEEIEIASILKLIENQVFSFISDLSGSFLRVWLGSNMNEKRPEFPVIAALFHTILFAYQKALRDILGGGQATFVHPVMETIRKINEDYQLSLIEGRHIEEAFDSLSTLLVQSGTVKVVKFEKSAKTNTNVTSTDAP